VQPAPSPYHFLQAGEFQVFKTTSYFLDSNSIIFLSTFLFSIPFADLLFLFTTAVPLSLFSYFSSNSIPFPVKNNEQASEGNFQLTKIQALGCKMLASTVSFIFSG
jgi:hypothetical protein